MALSDNARGAAFLTAAMAFFVVNDTAMKIAAADVPMLQAMAIRGLPVTLAFLAIAWRTGALARLRHLGDRLVVARTVVEVSGSLLFMLALPHIPLATALALNQTVPLLIVPLAVVLLKEKVGWRRALAVVGGFAGVLLILRPGTEGLNGWLLASFASAFFFALRDTLTRMIDPRIPSMLIAITMSGAVMVVCAGATWVHGWVPMTPSAWGGVAVACVTVGIGYLASVAAMRTGELSSTGAFRYSALIWATLLGWIVWGELPDALGWAGIALIVASGLYALHRARVRASGA
ncbi:MAG: DMT family transporter [Azospirillum sp.]|nr:DMT family transporter [Azospirillum sp.]MCZ8123866.1 DMT family transporter [Magnetospirillum sp.]